MFSFMITAGCETTLEAKLIWRFLRKEKNIYKYKTYIESMHQSEADSKNSYKTFVMAN